jgi:(S)-ureidoglycine aminohydrolase
MSYFYQVTGFIKDILSNRSVIKHGNFALIEPDGIVKNVIPGFENCEVTILASPKLGASFVDYLLTIKEGGCNRLGFGEDGVETFLYVFEGDLKVWNEEKEQQITDGGFIFCPENRKLYFENNGDRKVKAFLYKRRYDRIEGLKAHTVIGNINDVEWTAYEGMDDVLVKDFLPSATNIGFDMNFHILSFKPGACHGYIETHVQEHGAYIYSGQGMYNLDNEWIPVKKGDYLFMGAYSLQAAYGIGRNDEFAYIYSKDCNRDAKL